MRYNAIGEKNERKGVKMEKAKEENKWFIQFKKEYLELFQNDDYIDYEKGQAFIKKYRVYQEKIHKMPEKTEQMECLEQKLEQLDSSIRNHNERWIVQKLEENKEYFDHMLEKIDPNIHLDEEQRRAILTEDNHCLLIAGAGARKNNNDGSKGKISSRKKKSKTRGNYRHFLYKKGNRRIKGQNSSKIANTSKNRNFSFLRL